MDQYPANPVILSKNNRHLGVCGLVALSTILLAALIASAQDLEKAFATLQNAKPEVVIAALDSDDVSAREFALAQIARENKSDELTRAAVAAVASVKRPGVRAQLIAVLAERGDASAVPAVRAALKDADPTVRVAAAQACSLFKDEKAAPALFAMLGGEQDEAAREALRRIPGKAIDARLVKQVRKGTGEERVKALELLSARRYSGVFDLALDKELFVAGDPALAKAAAGVIRVYAPSGDFARLLAFALSLPVPSADLLAGALSTALDETPDRTESERRVGEALATCGPERAPLLTGLLAASQGDEALAVLSKRLESPELDTRKDALRNLGKWNGTAALVPMVLAARRERDAGAQTLAWRAVLDVVRRSEKAEYLGQPVSAIQQAVWYAPRREERVAALQALPLFHPKAPEVEWLLAKVEAECPDLAEEAQRVKASLIPPLACAESFDVGVAAYSFRKVTAFEAIEKTQACGGNVIEFFLWQKLSPEHPDVILNQDLSEGDLAALKAKLQACGVRAVSAYFNNAVFQDPAQTETKLRKVFAFAQKLGLRGLTGEPPVEQLDLVEKMVKETGLRFCFHNHPKNPAKPEYKNWDPVYLSGLMANRDPRMGFSLDTGHIGRSGLDAVETVKLLKGRVLSVHLKDVKEATRESIDVPYGQGICNIAGILAELKKQGFSGHAVVEYENITDHEMDDVKFCLAFIRSH